MNILIVDDELDYRLILGRLLDYNGNTVFLAEDGRDALRKMKHAKMDLIITDVYMPVMDGYALHSAVRQMNGYRTLPFLFVSAYSDDPTHSAVRDPKIDGFHRKERPVEELLAWIAFLTGSRKKPPVPQRQHLRTSPFVTSKT